MCCPWGPFLGSGVALGSIFGDCVEAACCVFASLRGRAVIFCQGLTVFGDPSHHSVSGVSGVILSVCSSPQSIALVSQQLLTIPLLGFTSTRGKVTCHVKTTVTIIAMLPYNVFYLLVQWDGTERC